MSSRGNGSVVPKKRRIEDQEDAWVAEEDQFVLRQAKKKAAIRVRGGRADPIDWLAIILRAIDTTRNLLDEEDDDEELDVVDPEGVFEGLSADELKELEKGIDNYLALEVERTNREFWAVSRELRDAFEGLANPEQTMKVICNDRLERLNGPVRTARGVKSIGADVDKLLAPKSYEELEKLEGQIRTKLKSKEPIDTDYWEHLLRTLLVWKARARLRKVSQAIVQSRLDKLRKEQLGEATKVEEKLGSILAGRVYDDSDATASKTAQLLDPDPLLKLRPEDKNLETIEAKDFLNKVVEERRRVLKLGYVPKTPQSVNKVDPTPKALPETTKSLGNLHFSGTSNEDFSKTTSALYEREVAKGVDENEEIFAGEETVTTASAHKWASKYRPRKPRYFNRVQMGYEWNKYNQTHYDHSNPPPKVVQGYKFNIFYPDLIDLTKAPTYRIEREGGRKRGQSFAPAGEEDTCLIRFIAGPPYEDIAFRIVDKEWDYSAKRERGFRSSFEKGILQLHFQFKKNYYRK